jgi:ribosomal protein L37AE/L43A
VQACANSGKRRQRPDCLQNDVFLWKANNYQCYNISEETKKKHNSSKVWLCINCASPKERGKKIPCPKHSDFLVYDARESETKGIKLEPVFLD